MVPVTQQAHELVWHAVRPGDLVVDATAGNGHDTLFLAKRVGAGGRVLAIDLQEAACDACRNKVAAEGWSNVDIRCGDHSRLEEMLPENCSGQVAAVMFNLGYLPGGDKSVVTRVKTTLSAMAAAGRILQPGGLLSVVAYRGHPGGMEEFIAVNDWMNQQAARGNIRVNDSLIPAGIGPVLLAMKKSIS